MPYKTSDLTSICFDKEEKGEKGGRWSGQNGNTK
jgi:hypothetical protein